MEQAERTVTIVNELGLHARAATKLVQLAGKSRCDVTLSRESMEVNAKSIMGVLTLVAAKGTVLTVRAAGEGASDVVQSIAQLIADRFGEER